MTRRRALRSLLGVAGLCATRQPAVLSGAGQGIASRGLGPGVEPRPGPAVARYVDIAARAGITAKTVIGGEKTKEFILETTGGGVAVFDYDHDGWLDIFLVNGSRLDGFRRGEEPTSHLYRNNRDGTFTDVTKRAGLARHGWGQGVCVGDFGNDGYLDLFVTYYGQNVLYHNNGDGTFRDVTRQSGLLTLQDRWNTGAAFLDYDRDGNLDLFVTSYVAYEDAKRYSHGLGQNCNWKGLPVMCGPRGLGGARSLLYHNNGNGTFTDVSEISGVSKAGLNYGFTPLVLDYNNDGWPDVYVSSDSAASLLFRNNHDGTFTELGISAGVAFNEDGREQGGMGASAGDYDCDGWLDIVKTNFADDTSSLYHNQGDGSFNDVTFAAGLGSNTRYVGWGAGFFDFDNDGWPDIFIANGHVYPEVDTAPMDSSYEQRKILYWNLRNGKFEDVSLRGGPGVLLKRSARGVAFGDLFNTGQIDIVINNMNAPPTVLHNSSPGRNHSLLVQLIAAQSNRSAIGARVRVEVGDHRMIEEVRSGGSFCSQNDLRLHFGLGASREVDLLEVQWPSGRKEVVKGVPGDQWVVFKEGAGVVRSQKFLARPKIFSDL
ncbi:MAG: RNA-binding protein [Acidobacteria bacterium]|nr:MAG: RNA-binding protein [Acidobacteriota bacterium]